MAIFAIGCYVKSWKKTSGIASRIAETKVFGAIRYIKEASNILLIQYIIYTIYYWPLWLYITAIYRSNIGIIGQTPTAYKRALKVDEI